MLQFTDASARMVLISLLIEPIIVHIFRATCFVSSESDAPLSYGIYVYMQSAAGRGPGAALGMVAVVIVAIGTYLSHRIIEKGRQQRSLENNHTTDPS